MERSNAFYNAGWIPVEERLPEDDNFVLMSFKNFTLPMIGRYEQQGRMEAVLGIWEIVMKKIPAWRMICL